MATTHNTPKGTPPSSGKKLRKQEAATSPMEQITLFIKGIRSEWTKISWPTWPQIWGQTIIVLIMVTIMTLGLFILDYSLHFTINSIIPHRR